ncbi:28S ribosomal protein S14, mitochondrial [Frankliniella fusca]|uniref:Small ribosomal subunit protein uS14 n=1 Tax=Frankliniella fusca TaxID=407009 RepID=A0AAE1LHB3_9NEOP|nr:28S ribosomal protein S14, mitochondrial [Frankliniella fusca]
MSLLKNGFRSLVSSLFFKTSNPAVQVQQVRTKFVNRHQRKDQVRRVTVKNFGEERMLLNTVYRCTVLPPEVRAVAQKDVIALPRDSNYIRLRKRCYATSRPRGVVHDFRVSRIIFRELADYNKLCGMQRSMWALVRT